MPDPRTRFTTEVVPLFTTSFSPLGTVHYDLEQISLEGNFTGQAEVRRDWSKYYCADPTVRVAAVKDTDLRSFIEGANNPESESKLSFTLWRLAHHDPSSNVRAACLDVVSRALQSPEANKEARSALLGELVHFVCIDPNRNIKHGAIDTLTRNQDYLFEPGRIKLDGANYSIASVAQGLSAGLTGELGHIVDKDARSNVIKLVGKALILGTSQLEATTEEITRQRDFIDTGKQSHIRPSGESYLASGQNESRAAALEQFTAKLEISMRQLLRHGSDFQEHNSEARVEIVNSLACRLPREGVVNSLADCLNRGSYSVDSAIISAVTKYLDQARRSGETVKGTEAWNSLEKQLNLSARIAPRLKNEAARLLERMPALSETQDQERSTA